MASKNNDLHPESNAEKVSKQASHVGQVLTQTCSPGGRVWVALMMEDSEPSQRSKRLFQ